MIDRDAQIAIFALHTSKSATEIIYKFRLLHKVMGERFSIGIKEAKTINSDKKSTLNLIKIATAMRDRMKEARDLSVGTRTLIIPPNKAPKESKQFGDFPSDR